MGKDESLDGLTPAQAFGRGFRHCILSIPILVFVVLVLGGLVFFVLSNHEYSAPDIPTGFAKIKPQLAGTGLTHDGTFKAVFTNGVGTRINVGIVSVTGSDGNTINIILSNHTVEAGENFAVSAEGFKGGKVGDFYSLSVTIPYTVEFGGVTREYKENGTIPGRME